MTTLAIMQPTYLPWLGYFEMIRQADYFVFYDSAQYVRRSWHHRNRIRNAEGELMLSVPVLVRGRREQSIAEAEIASGFQFPSKHLRAIEHNYSKAPHFDRVFPLLSGVYERGHESLLALNLDLIAVGCACLSLQMPETLSSSLGIRSRRVEALVDVCRRFGAKRYLAPPGSAGYINQNNLFPGAGIELAFFQYQHPVYQQMRYGDFISHLAFIDYLFNCGASPP